MLHLNAFSLASFVSALISASLAVYAWPRRGQVVPARAFALSMAALAVWSIAYGLELATAGEAEKALWAKASYLGSVVVPPAWLACVRRYAGRPPMRRWALVLLAIEPLLLLAMLATNDAHHLYWASTNLREVAGRRELVVHYAVGAWINIAYCYALISASTFVLLRSLVRAPRQHREQVLALLLAIAAPWAAHITYVLGYAPFPGLELTSFAFTLTGISMAFALFRLGLFELMPVAQSAIVARMRDGIVVINTDGLVAHVNPAAEEMLEVAAREVVGRRAAEVLEPLAALVASSGEGDFEGEMQRGAGEAQRLFEVRVAGLDTVEGRHCGHLVVLRDATLSKRAELALLLARDEAVAAARSKAEFLATMSHEIRTPMNGVIGTTEILLGTRLDHDQRDLAGTVRDSAYALLGILNSILDFSKIEAGELEPERVDFDPHKVLEDVVGLFGARARNQGIELLSTCPDSVPSAVRGDVGRLRQVITNLVSNAVKFTERGSVSVRCETLPRAGEQIWLRIAVSDTGIGIAADQQARLFEPFVQADSSTTRRYGGTGLGLAICKRLVELLGGEIDFSSQAGAGSTFEVVLPFEAATASSLETVERPKMAGDLVLVVDARTATRRFLESQLRAWGGTIDTAEQVVQAVAILRMAARQGHPFGWVFVDAEAAGADLERFLHSIHSESKLKHAHVVLLTDVAGGQQVESLRRRGLLDATVLKPLRESRLRECIVGLLRGETAAAAEPPPSRAPVRIALEPRAPKELPPAAPASGEAAGAARILVVEDNVVNQKVAKRLLLNLGHVADVAADGIQALEAIAAGNYELILMDCQMPVMDGFQATAEIRRREGEGRHMPIIAMTANAMEGDRERCLESGMDDYLAKPVRPPDLAAILAKWLPKQAAVA